MTWVYALLAFAAFAVIAFGFLSAHFYGKYLAAQLESGVYQALCERHVAEHAAAVVAHTEQVGELNDRLQAKSLAELKAYRPTAMPLPDTIPHNEYLYDSTGLIRTEAPALVEE